MISLPTEDHRIQSPYLDSTVCCHAVNAAVNRGNCLPRFGSLSVAAKQSWVLRTLCDADRGHRLATTPGGAGPVPAGVRSARSLPPDAPAEQGNRPTPRVHARLPTWWFDFLEGEGGGRPSHEVRKTRKVVTAPGPGLPR